MRTLISVFLIGCLFWVGVLFTFRGRAIFAIMFSLIIANYAMMLHMERLQDVRAIRLIQQGRGEDAVGLLADLDEKSQSSNTVRLIRSLAHLQAGNTDAAQEEVRPIHIQAEETLTEADLAILASVIALALLHDGEVDEAIKLADLDRDLKPAPANWLTVRSLAHYAAGNNDEALRSANQAIATNPGYFWTAYHDVYNPWSVVMITRVEYLHTLRAMIYCEAGKLDEAIADLNFALQKNPDFALAYLCRGHARSLKNERHLAHQDFDLFVTSQPKDVEESLRFCQDGVLIKKILVPYFCLALHRTNEDTFFYEHVQFDAPTNSGAEFFPRNGALPIAYEPSPESDRQRHYYWRNPVGNFTTWMGFAFLAIGMMTWQTTRRTTVLQQRGERRWTEARVKHDRWDFDYRNHSVFAAGIVLISLASLRVTLAPVMFFIFTVLLIAAIARLVFLNARATATVEDIE